MRSMLAIFLPKWIRRKKKKPVRRTQITPQLFTTFSVTTICKHSTFRESCIITNFFLLPSFQDVADAEDAEDAEGEEEEMPEDVEMIDPIVEPSPPEDGSGVAPGSSTDRVESSPSAARTEIDDEQNEVDDTSARVSKANEIYERYGLICPDVDTPLEMILPDNQLGLDPPHEFELHGIEDIEVSEDDGEEWTGPPLYRSLAMGPIDVDSLENDENDGSVSGPNHTV